MKQHQPPKWFERFLEWYCADYYLEEVQGDLHEWFQRRVERHGVFQAKLRYCLDVLRYFRLFRLKPFHHLINHSKNLTMKNLFKITYRNFLRDKVSGVIRLGNLILGISIFILALVYTRYELSYDDYHEKKDRIYRVGAGNVESAWAATPLGAGPYALEQLPEVKRMTRMIPIRNTWVKNGDDIFYENGGFEADSSIFQMFSYDFIQGNPATALTRPESIVITESFAKKYFGNEDPMGKTLELLVDRGDLRTVTGVISDVPKQSHLTFDFLCSIYTFPDDYLRSWRNFFVYTYLEFEEGAKLDQAKSVLLDKYIDAYDLTGPDLAVVLNPVNKIHLFVNDEKEYADNGNIYYVYILFSIGLFVLLISCINFINLTVIKGLDRAREVGLRKAIGASRRELIYQFMGENIILLTFAGVIALMVLGLAAPMIHQFTGLDLPLNVFLQPQLALITLGILVFLQLFSGLYPAAVLSKFKPAQIIKPGAFNLPMKRVGFTRQALVVVQFSLSVVLIIGSMVVYKQLDYMQSRDMGFEKDQVVIFKLNYEINQKIDQFKNRMLSTQGVESMATSSSVPGYRIMFESVRSIGQSEEFGSRLLLADRDFLDTYQIAVQKGKTFSEQVPDNRVEYILNEALTQRLFPEGGNPIGKQLIQSGDTGRVVAVVDNFNFKSLHDDVEPLLIKRRESNWGYASIRFSATNTTEVLAQLERASAEVYPDLPVLEPEFMSDRFADLYTSETRLKDIVWVFCLITVILTISGIFSIASYNTQKRAKEIAVRKVLGGEVWGIVTHLSKSFIILLMIALSLSIPGAYMLSNWWLQDFAYVIGLSPMVFVLAGFTLLVIVLLGSGFVTFRAAIKNPSEVLKYE